MSTTEVAEGRDYIVTIKRTEHVFVRVVANSRIEAMNLASEKLEPGWETVIGARAAQAGEDGK